MDYPLTPHEIQTIQRYHSLIKEFEDQVSRAINTNAAITNLLLILKSKISNSFYFGFTMKHYLWITTLCRDLGIKERLGYSLTIPECAQVLIEYQTIPQLEPIDDLLQTLPSLFQATTYIYQPDKAALQQCILTYPRNLRLYINPEQHQAIQLMRNNLLTFLATEMTQAKSMAEIINQKIIWFSEFLQHRHVETPEGK